MTEIALLDLFSGIGGFSIGLERAGFTTKAFVEIDPYCQAVLRHRFPGVYIHDDVRTITAESLRQRGIDRIDAICGGFPCQDLSVAGKRAGLAGARSGLWFEYVRIVRELRPRVVIVENVPGLLSAGFGQVLGDLATLGYDAWWDCIPASAVGAPHRRDRVWVVAYAPSGRARRDGERPAREVLPAGAEPGVANADGRRPEAAGDGGGDRSTGGDREAGVVGGGGPHADDVANASGVEQPQELQSHDPLGGQRKAKRRRELLDTRSGAGGGTVSGGHAEGDGKHRILKGDGGDGAEDVADTARQRVEGNGPGGQQEPRAPVKKRVPRRDRTEFPDADPAVREGAVEHGDQGGIPGPADEGGRRSEPGLGGMVDGVPRWVDARAWLQEPEEVPRVALGIENRANRLKCLGNSVVPQITYALGAAIMEAIFSEHPEQNG